jgi:single-strand DNA-binding protein
MKTQEQNNNVKLIVNLGTNPTVKQFPNGKKMARFSVASVEPAENGGPNEIKWYSVTSWGTLADVAQQHLQKGKRVMLIGHLVIRNWTDKKGNARSRREIIASNLVLLHSGRTPVANCAA